MKINLYKLADELDNLPEVREVTIGDSLETGNLCLYPFFKNKSTDFVIDENGHVNHDRYYTNLPQNVVNIINKYLSHSDRTSSSNSSAHSKKQTFNISKNIKTCIEHLESKIYHIKGKNFIALAKLYGIESTIYYLNNAYTSLKTIEAINKKL